MNKWYRSSFWCIAFFGLGIGTRLFAASPHSGPSRNAPNILILYADDMGIGDMSVYNPLRGKIHTPNLDRLAAQGMMFTDAHSAGAVCSPSRYGLLTGRYPFRTSDNANVGIYGVRRIPAERLTIADLAKEHGYTTACFGKWHLGWDWPFPPSQMGQFLGGGYDDPKDIQASVEQRELWRSAFSKPIKGGPVAAGFDEYFGVDAPNWPPYVWIENERVTHIPSEFGALELFAPDMANVQGPAAPDWSLEAVLPTLTERTVAFIKREAEKPGPYFAYFAMTSPHTPLAVNEEWKGKSKLSRYADLMLETDAMVGRVLAALEESGEADRTLMIFSADNGCFAPYADPMKHHGHYASGPFRGYKAHPWEGGNRLPFVVRWPEVVTPGSRSDQLINQTDLMATLAELFGYTLPPDAGEDSFSFLSVLQGKGTSGRKENVSTGGGTLALRKGSWKYITANPNGFEGIREIQLYDLSTDIGESNNLVSSRTDKVEEMQVLLDQLIAQGRSTPGPRQKHDSQSQFPQP